MITVVIWIVCLWLISWVCFFRVPQACVISIIRKKKTVISFQWKDFISQDDNKHVSGADFRTGPIITLSHHCLCSHRCFPSPSLLVSAPSPAAALTWGSQGAFQPCSVDQPRLGNACWAVGLGSPNLPGKDQASCCSSALWAQQKPQEAEILPRHAGAHLLIQSGGIY